MAAILRAGIIGDTGRGNYGHGLDTAYDGISGVEVVAVADPDPAGASRRQCARGRFASMPTTAKCSRARASTWLTYVRAGSASTLRWS